MSIKPATWLWIWVTFFLVSGLLGVYSLLQIPVISIPALLAVALYYVLEPLITRWESQGRTRLSALIIIFASFGVLGIFAAVNLPNWMQEQWVLVQEKGPTMIANFRAKISNLDQMIQRDLPFAADVSLADSLKNAGDYASANILPAIPGVLAKSFMGGLLVPIITFFLLFDGRNARKRMLETVPNRHFEMALNIFHRMDHQVGSYLRGVMVEAVLVGLVAYVVLLILGVPGAALIGTVVAVTNLIPYFGPVAGLVTGFIYCALAGNFDEMWLRVVAAIGTAQLSDNFVIGPTVIGKAVNIHALVVILLLLVAGNLFGLIGLVIAVPMWAVIRVVLQETVIAVRAYGRFMVD